MKVSFDFDSTLSLPIVQDFARSLISKNIDVWVITSRHSEDAPPFIKINRVFVKHNNDDLFKVTDTLGIPREKIIFTNGELKSTVIKNNNFLFHLDDDWVEVKFINLETDCRGISNFGNKDWKNECKKLLDHI